MARKAEFNMERFFQALGDNTRLRLLNLMGDQEVCVCYLVEILDAPQPKISRHLAYLRKAGIVSVRARGCTIGSSCLRILERRKFSGRRSIH